MANGNNTNNSWDQKQHEKQNDARRGNEDKVPGIDKKLNGPNRPST